MGDGKRGAAEGGEKKEREGCGIGILLYRRAVAPAAACGAAGKEPAARAVERGLEERRGTAGGGR